MARKPKKPDFNVHECLRTFFSFVGMLINLLK
jgi:hypothetical protein